MNSLRPPSSQITAHPMADVPLIQTPRHRMITIILDALLRKEPVTLGRDQVRLCKRGETFTDGDYDFEALQTGLYQRFGVWEHKTPLDGPPHHYTWCHVGDLGWYEDIITPILDQLSAYDREYALLNITVPLVMKQIRADRRRRPQLQEVAHDET